MAPSLRGRRGPHPALSQREREKAERGVFIVVVAALIVKTGHDAFF